MLPADLRAGVNALADAAQDCAELAPDLGPIEAVYAKLEAERADLAPGLLAALESVAPVCDHAAIAAGDHAAGVAAVRHTTARAARVAGKRPAHAIRDELAGVDVPEDCPCRALDDELNADRVARGLAVYLLRAVGGLVRRVKVST